MKKIIFIILMITLLPIFAFAKLEVETFNFKYTYDWISFLGIGKQEYGKEGNWKYGYKDFDASTEDQWCHYYIPNKPKGYKIPEYLKNYPIINKNINVSNIKDAMFKESDAIRLVEPNWEMFSGDLGEINFVFGVTKNNDWFVVNNNKAISRSNPHDKFRPFRDASVSIQKTIKMHCELEKRDPTISEKYIMLYLETCTPLECDDKDREYKAYYAKEYEKAQRDETIFQILWTLRIVGWLLLALFAFILPGLVLVLLKCIFPKGSIIYNAVCIVEGMLWIFVISYWYGNKR